MENNPLDRARDIAGQVTRAVSDVTQGISGRGVAEKVDEFTEVYTEVLVGVHGELETMQAEQEAAFRRLGITESQVQELLDRETIPGAAIASEVHLLRRLVLLFGLISIGAAIVAGLALWLAL